MKIKGCRLSEHKQKRLSELFVAGATALTAAELANVNKDTAILFFKKLRQIIVFGIEIESGIVDGPVEVDESYFGGKRKGKRGRGAAGKVPVFGLLKRGGKVYACVVENTQQTTLKHIIRQKIAPDSLVYSDKYSSYNFLNASGFKHERINHSKEFVRGLSHINGVENFWNQAKRHMRKFNGITKENFNLFLQESVFRFNYSSSKEQLKLLRKWSKMYYKSAKKETK